MRSGSGSGWSRPWRALTSLGLLKMLRLLAVGQCRLLILLERGLLAVLWARSLFEMDPSGLVRGYWQQGGMSGLFLLW